MILPLNDLGFSQNTLLTFHLTAKLFHYLGPSSTISQMVTKFDWSVKFINHLTDSRGRALVPKKVYVDAAFFQCQNFHLCFYQLSITVLPATTPLDPTVSRIDGIYTQLTSSVKPIKMMPWCRDYHLRREKNSIMSLGNNTNARHKKSVLPSGSKERGGR